MPDFEIITIVAIVVAIVCLLINLKKPNKTLPIAALIISTGAAIQAIYSPTRENTSEKSFEKLTQAFDRLEQLPSPGDQFRVWYPEDPSLSPITTILSKAEKNNYLEERRKITD